MKLSGKVALHLSATLIASTGAHAQDQTPAQSVAETASADDIVVTATRREQALQDVPIAVTALTAESLANARVNSTAELMQAVPNVTISSQVGAMVVYVRGVGQLATNAGQEPSVATYVDGVYQPTVFGALTSLANVQRVEVIKGPQGTLFGRNATGGLINIATKDPGQDPSAEFVASFGNYDATKVATYVSSGLGEGVAADLSAYYYNQNKGIGRNVVSGRRLRGMTNADVRSKLLFELGDSTRIKLAGSYTDNKGSSGVNLSLLPGSVGVDGSTTLPGFYDIQANGEPFYHNRTWQVSGKIEQEFEPFDLVSITAYTHTKDFEHEDNDSTPLRVLDVILTQKARIFTQEVQLVSKKGSDLTWILGAFYYNSDAKGTPTGTGLYGLAFGGGGIQARGFLKTESIAVYGEATYEVLPKLNLTIGGRYTRDKKKLSGFFDSTDGNGVVLGSAPVQPTSKTFKEPTYRAIVDYHLTDDIMAYASYSRGFKSGGYDTGFPTGVPFDPEIIDAFEGGLKMQLLDRKLTLNIAGFYYDYQDLQLPILVNVNGQSSQITVNAADATVKGIDIDGNFKIDDYSRINFGVGVLNSKFGTFDDAPCTSRTPDGQTIQFVCDVKGKKTTHAPKLTFNIGGTLGFPTSIGIISATANYSRQSKFFYDVTNRLVEPAYGILNGSIGWTSMDERFNVALFAENLTDEKYTIAQYGQAGLGDTYVAGRPRMYGVELRAKF